MVQSTEAAIVNEGVKYDVMNPKLVDATIKRRDVKVQRGMTLINKVGLLQVHYRKNTPHTKLVECDVCHAASNIDEDDACPYCGTGEDQPGAPKTTTAAKPKNTKPSTTIVKAPAAKTEAAPADLVTVSDAEAVEKLNEAVRKIVTLKAGADASQWLLGREIQQVFESKDYRFRRDPESNKPLYRSFGQFCAKELELSASQCYRLMDVAKTFTEEQVRKIGTTKLKEVLKLPEAQRPELVQKIETENLSLRPIIEEVKRMDPSRRQEPGRRDTPAGSPGANRRLPEGALTIAVVPGTKSVQMFCRPKSKELESDQKKAKTIEDKPCAVIELAGDVKIFLQIIEGSTGLVCKYELKKVDPLEE